MENVYDIGHRHHGPKTRYQGQGIEPWTHKKIVLQGQGSNPGPTERLCCKAGGLNPGPTEKIIRTIVHAISNNRMYNCKN